MSNTKRNSSFTRQIMFIVAIIIIATMGICYFFNAVLLERYYIAKKQNTMMEIYDSISNASNNGILDSEEYDIDFENLTSNNNVRIIVVDETGKLIRSSVNDMRLMQEELFEIAGNMNHFVTIEENDNYRLIKRNDERLSEEYLILAGQLDNGNFILMRTAIESIRESADLANRFLLMVGTIMILFGIIVSGVISKKITKPIRQLTYISKRMVNLDFEAKFERNNKWRDPEEKQFVTIFNRHELAEIDPDDAIGGNEIDKLGAHFNILSEKLEETISELKSANVELQKDLAKKEEIDEMRKEFLSNVSHELKTPLAIIQGYAEGLKECINEDEESRDYYCDVIMDETAKMNRMVLKLLSLNQLEFGNDEAIMERFNIAELIRGVANTSSKMMNQKGVTFTNDLPEELYVWGDQFKIEEVITNYLSNALNHVSGENKIQVFHAIKDDKVRISVFNTGHLIPEDDLDKVWIKFYKVDKARTREYGGSGIGLSIVKAIMESMGGDYGVFNHEDGVEFWFELTMK